MPIVLLCVSQGYSSCQAAFLQVCEYLRSTRNVWCPPSNILTSTEGNRSLPICQSKDEKHYFLLFWSAFSPDCFSPFLSSRSYWDSRFSCCLLHVHAFTCFSIGLYAGFLEIYRKPFYIRGVNPLSPCMIQLVPLTTSVVLLILFMISFGFQKWLIFF